MDFFFTMESDCKPIPHDIIFNILSRLRVKELYRLRRISKPWLALISDPLFHRTHRRVRGKNPLPLVTTIEDDGCPRPRITISILDKESETLAPVTQLTLEEDELEHYSSPRAITTCMDLTCSFERRNVYVCNPVTKKWIHLTGGPGYHIGIRVWTVALGYIASTSSYKVFRVFSNRTDNYKDGVKFEVLTLGSNHWRAVDSPPGDVLLGFNGANKGATIDGSLYLQWNDSRRRNRFITVFDLKEEAWSVVPFPSDLHDDVTYRSSLREMGGRLCLANWCGTSVGRHWLELWLLKAPHENRPIWEKGRSIDISMVDQRWPSLLALEQETWKILLRTWSGDRKRYELQWYDTNNQTMEVIYHAPRYFTACLYVESFPSLDVK